MPQKGSFFSKPHTSPFSHACLPASIVRCSITAHIGRDAGYSQATAKDVGHAVAADVQLLASWGYFDYRQKGEGFDEGYQSVPVNWSLSSQRKRSFFQILHDVTGQ